MRKWCIVAGVVAVCAGMAAVPILAQDKEKGDRDNARIERELESLEAQRDKIDARIRDLRRQMGRRDSDVRVEKRNLKDLSPEQRKEVEKAIDEAHRAVRESLKNLPNVKAFAVPDGKAFVMPDIKEHFKVFTDPEFKEHFKVFATPDGKFEHMTPEQQRKFELHMKEFGEKMGRMGEEMGKKFQNFKFDSDGPDVRVFKGDGPNARVFRLAPRDGKNAPEVRVLRPGDGDSSMRRELEDLRRELRELREEIRKNRGGKTTSTTESVFDL